MDSKRYSQDKINEILFQYYLFKFRTTRFDLIVTSDNNAYEFIIRYGERLFPGVPIVFCGLNDVAAGDVPMRHRMTGLLEEFDVPANIAIAARLHPISFFISSEKYDLVFIIQSSGSIGYETSG